MTGRWSQQRVSDERATQAVAPPQASIAARQAGLVPDTLAATLYRQGSLASCRMRGNLAAAHGGFVCHRSSSGTRHGARLEAYAGLNQPAGKTSRCSTSTYPCREAYPAKTPT